MKNWSIRKQIMVLALLPALFVGFCLAIYFTYTQLEYISESLQKHGESIVTQIAPSSEYAVFSGNTDLLVPTLRNALKDQDVVTVIIKDKDNNILLSLTDETPPTQQHSLWKNIIETRLLNFRAPITSQEVAVDDFNEAMLLSSVNPNPIRNIIGYVELIVTTQYSDNEKFESLNKGIMLTIMILIASFLLAMRISKQIATPVRQLTDTVRKIASGDFKTRINQDAPGELGTLESYVNTMASELQSYQGDMETRIDDFTHELQQTLEELEIRNAELDITRSNALAANRAKSEFLANMSHEIRTPLGGIIGFSELLDSTQMDEQQKDYVSTIRKSAGNLLNIIDDILDLSKIESGKLEIAPVVFNLLDVIEEVVDLLSPVAYEKNIELLYDLHKDVPRIIEADPVRIRQVLINL
ncbi:MAG: histidine kinase dimerization/phospho-acceptor domain-containing protein, partial [Gammaproteobacteria bacterium]